MTKSARVAAIAAGIILSWGAVSGAQAFCVYNYTTRTLEFRQTPKPGNGDYLRGGFHKVIGPGGKACCNWQDGGCNPDGKKTSTVYMDVTDQSNQRYRCDYHQWGTTLQAGGWLEVYERQVQWDKAITGLSCVSYPAG